MIGREPRAGVVRETEVIRVLRIDPDVVIVAAPRHFDERLAAVGRRKKLLFAMRISSALPLRDLEMDVVAGAADERTLIVDDLPRRAAVVGAPDRP